MSIDRAESAYRFRVEAAEFARHRLHPNHNANGDEARFGTASYPMNFTKGLEHDCRTGLVSSVAHFEAFRTAIDNGFAEPFTTSVPVPRQAGMDRRPWEAPTAGVVFELEGPDPQAVTMPPAPELGSDELTFEMAEVYEMALLRDEPFTSFESGAASTGVGNAVARLNALPYATGNASFANRNRKTNTAGQLDAQTVFRGSSPGSEVGPYLSQFMLIGNAIKDAGLEPADGRVAFGAQTIDQRVLEARKLDDYMVAWSDWLDVQNGFRPTVSQPIGQDFTGNTRFIFTPRDLATYVHIDALYQAYLNACLLLLGQRAPFDPAFDLLSGMGDGVLDTPSSQTLVPLNAGGFALWGGPHILSLVTEVATRGLKAVRYQKFNVHLRLRPEALAARLEKVADIEASNPSICGRLWRMHSELSQPTGASGSLLDAIRQHNTTLASPARNPRRTSANTVLLPMAFAEGSPMHPTYGAGHATVAGACVTMLKAFFDTSAVFVRTFRQNDNGSEIEIDARFLNKAQIIEALRDGLCVTFGAYRSVNDGSGLEFRKCGNFGLTLNCAGLAALTAPTTSDEDRAALEAKCWSDIAPGYLDLISSSEDGCCPLTLEGELNKLAANISIGRNMAGVHYFSDYYDSIRMGEEIAIGILEEQALGYQTDRFVMNVPTFDGEIRRVGNR